VKLFTEIPTLQVCCRCNHNCQVGDNNFLLVPGYVDLDESFNPTAQVSSNLVINDLYSITVLARSALLHGIAKIKKALVSGNYFKPTGVYDDAYVDRLLTSCQTLSFVLTGLGFGGKELTQSARNLIDLAGMLGTDEARSIILIDVHTGLGPSGT
jgi:hypothetical protein